MPSDQRTHASRAQTQGAPHAGSDRITTGRGHHIHVDRDGILRAGTRLVALSPLSAQIIESLLDQAGALVRRRDLAAKLWPDEAPSDCRTLDNRIKHLRRHLVGIPLVIHTVRGQGYLLEHG